MMVQKSPARLLRERFPLAEPIIRSNRRHVGDWIKLGDGTPVRCGLHVYDVADLRHVGRIESYQGVRANVRWEETGWVSNVPCADLRRAKI